VEGYGVPGFVIGHQTALALGDDPALAFRAEQDTLDGFLKIALGDALLVLAGGDNGPFVDQVLDVGADKAGRGFGQDVQVDIARQRLALDMHLEDFLTSAQIGAIQHDAAVEAARAHQGRVEDVRAVGGGDDDHVGIGVKAVHLDQDLVQGLLALVVAAAQPGAAMPPNRVDLIDEDDARAVAFGLVEQVTHAAGAYADEHLHELGAGNAEEGDARFPGDGLGQEGLAGAGAAYQQHALGDARAKLDELLRLLQELDDFPELFLGFIHAGHIVEGYGGLIAGEHAGAALAEGEGLVIGTLGLAEHQVNEATKQQQRQDVDQDAQPGASIARGRVLQVDGLQLFRVGSQGDELLRGGQAGILAADRCAAIPVAGGDLVVGDDQTLDPSGIHILDQLAE